MPGRHNPKIRGNLHRRKLRLRQTDPVLFGHRFDVEHLAGLKWGLQKQQVRSRLGLGEVGKQGRHLRSVPTWLGWRHARLAKQGGLAVTVGIGVLHRNTQRVQGFQSLAQPLHAVLRREQAQLMHQRLRAAIHASK